MTKDYRITTNFKKRKKKKVHSVSVFLINVYSRGVMKGETILGSFRGVQMILHSGFNSLGKCTNGLIDETLLILMVNMIVKVKW